MPGQLDLSQGHVLSPAHQCLVETNLPTFIWQGRTVDLLESTCVYLSGSEYPPFLSFELFKRVSIVSIVSLLSHKTILENRKTCYTWWFGHYYSQIRRTTWQPRIKLDAIVRALKPNGRIDLDCTADAWSSAVTARWVVTNTSRPPQSISRWRISS